MKLIMEFINNFIDTVSGVLYQPWCVPLLLLAGGIILTIRSKLMQARLFIDTLLICTATAFMCLSSGASFGPEIGGAAYVQTSMAENLGAFGPVFLSAAMSLFAFTTLIGNYSYCEGCLRFILNRAVSRGGILAFRSLATLLVFVGAIANAGTVWNLADMTQGLMVLVNLPVILILAKPAFLCLEDYCKQKKDGKNPVFIAKDAGIDAELDFWK